MAKTMPWCLVLVFSPGSEPWLLNDDFFVGIARKRTSPKVTKKQQLLLNTSALASYRVVGHNDTMDI